MPKFARSNSYNGKQSNQNWTGAVRAATENEVEAGDSAQLYVSPLTLTAALDDVVAPVLASPPPIGEDTPNDGTFTALTANESFNLNAGDATITDGDVIFGTAGSKIILPTGANASVGTSAAMTAGAVTVATTASSTTALVFYSRKVTGGTPGNVSITAQSGTGFTLTSTSNTETSTFNWWIINA